MIYFTVEFVIGQSTQSQLVHSNDMDSTKAVSEATAVPSISQFQDFQRVKTVNRGTSEQPISHSTRIMTHLDSVDFGKLLAEV
jgi:hypothetical protein